MLRAPQQHEHFVTPAPLEDGLRSGLQWLCEFLPTAPPRRIQVDSSDAVVHVFTDGACEPDSVTVGACLFEAGCRPEAFGSTVPSDIVERWRRSGAWQVVGQAELAPVRLAAAVWAERLRGRYVVWWLDQDAARLGLVKGYSPSEFSADLIDRATIALSNLMVFSWFARVPSPSNPADWPSRLQWAELRAAFPQVVVRALGGDSWAVMRGGV